MYAEKFANTPHFLQIGNTYNMLLPRDISECTEAAMVRVKKGNVTPPHAHHEEEQTYFILEGKGLLKIGKEEKEVGGGTVAFIPRHSEHQITCTSDEDLVYIYVAVWPEGIPKDEKEWRKAYKQQD